MLAQRKDVHSPLSPRAGLPQFIEAGDRRCCLNGKTVTKNGLPGKTQTGVPSTAVAPETYPVSEIATLTTPDRMLIIIVMAGKESSSWR
jgi:hypothetical protein